ncbi:Surfeit locus protein 6 [Abeliophyllum distichum]|uniref:Surfeit locus protein 6 n=1 Tax=Abeliophyllum distichum TaxID=126358 RepID=A0ABD1QHV3_9LAMI
MMKKQQKVTVSPSTPTPSINLKSVIQSYSLFFDHLIELIPAKFYLTNDDAESKPWYQGLSRAAKASLKQQSKLNLKLVRRNRLDPENKSSSSTLHLLQQQINEISESDPDELNRKGSFGDLGEDGDEGETRVKSMTWRRKFGMLIEMSGLLTKS